MSLPIPFLLTAALACTLANAQTAVGDIAITGFSTTQFGIRASGAGTSVTGYSGALGGLTQTILWDDQQPDSFVLGGAGFVCRATILGAGSALVTPLAGGVDVADLAWDLQHQLVLADFSQAQLLLLDPATGIVVPITSGTQPWGTELFAVAVDPLTGDIVCGGAGGLHRIPNGSTTATTIVGGLGGAVSGITFDPQNGDVLATVLTVNRVLRVDATGAVSDICPPFAVPGPNALDLDENGDLITGGGTGQVYAVPRAGGAATYLFDNTSPFGPLNGLAVVGGGGYGRAFGSPCSGASGPATLTADGAFRTGTIVTLTSHNHAAATPGVLILGLDRDVWGGLPLPFDLDPVLGTSGCSLHCSVDATLAALTSATGPAELSFSFLLNPSFQGRTFFAQHACLEPVPGGISFSNGVAFAIR